MIDHLSLGVTDLGRAIRFYDAAFAPLGYDRQLANEKEAAWGPDGAPTFWIYPAAAGQPVVGTGTHIAIAASSPAAVQASHDAAVAAGGSAARTPGKRPDISQSYYGAVLLDPDGHRLEIVCGG